MYFQRSRWRYHQRQRPSVAMPCPRPRAREDPAGQSLLRPACDTLQWMKPGALSVVVLAVLLTAGGAACGGRSSDTLATSQPAASIHFLAGKTFATDSAAVREGRVNIVFVSDSATRREVRHLGKRIAAMQVVEQYAFMSNEDLLPYLGYPLGFGHPPSWLPPAESPSAGLWLLLRSADQVALVTFGLQDDPTLDRRGVSHVGVRLAQDSYAHVAGPRPSASPTPVD